MNSHSSDSETVKSDSFTPQYSRVLLKLSGESLMGENAYGINKDVVGRVCDEIKTLVENGVQVCVVVGGGNIFRGIEGTKDGIDRATSDYMGMLATVMNALALQSSLENIGVYARVQSAIPMDTICEPYVRRKALRHIRKGRVIIFAAGTGNPYFTTDTAATLRASEMNCEVLMKGTKVDGIYDADPSKNPDAKHYQNLDYKTILQNNLNVMDMTAIALARDNNLPVLVFSIKEEKGLLQAVQNKGKFTLVKS